MNETEKRWPCPVCPSCGRTAVDQGYQPFWACTPADGAPGCVAASAPLQFCVWPIHGNRLAVDDTVRTQLADHADMRMKYAGAVGVLADSAVYLSGSMEGKEQRESHVRAIDDWCKLTGWTYRCVLNRIDLYPPKLGEKP